MVSEGFSSKKQYDDRTWKKSIFQIIFEIKCEQGRGDKIEF